MDLKLNGEAMQALASEMHVGSVLPLDDGRLLIVGKSATMAAAIERVPVGEDEHAVIIDRALLANISLPVGDYGELVERLRDIARRRAETNEPGGSPPEIMSEWLAADALEIQAGALEIQAAELNRATEHHQAQDTAIASLQGEVERLQDYIDTLHGRPRRDRTRDALSQRQGEGEKP